MEFGDEIQIFSAFARSFLFIGFKRLRIYFFYLNKLVSCLVFQGLQFAAEEGEIGGFFMAQKCVGGRLTVLFLLTVINFLQIISHL